MACSPRSRRRDGGRGEDVKWAVGRHLTNRAFLDSAHHFPSDRIMLAAFCADHGEKQVNPAGEITWGQHIDCPIDRISFAEETTDDRRHLLNREDAAPGDLTSPGPLEKPPLFAGAIGLNARRAPSAGLTAGFSGMVRRRWRGMWGSRGTLAASLMGLAP
jgi:hypothetical protein